MGQISFDTELGNYRLAHTSEGAPDEIGRCGFFWLGGYRSDMMGSKAESLSELARSSRRSISIIAPATTTRVNHLLSAGTMYHGACFDAVLRIMSS